MSRNKCLSDHPELIAVCMSCTKDDCHGECKRYRAKFRELMGLPAADRQMREPKSDKPHRPRKERPCRKYAAFGQELTMLEWERKTGIQGKTIRARLKKGMPMEEALTRKDGRGSPQYITYDGQTRHVSEWAEYAGIKRCTLRTRLERGETLPYALRRMDSRKEKGKGARCNGGNH